MSNNSIAEKLLSLWATDRLAHFYIVQPSPTEENPREFTQKWIENFLINIIMNEKNVSRDNALHKLKLGSGDILQITKEDENENYKVDNEQFLEFFKFQNFSPLELKQRFIVINDAHSIQKVLSNKLLKTLEEPAAKTTIFLLDPYRKKVLPTISSRAIYIRIPTNIKEDSSSRVEKLSEYLAANGLKDGLIEAVKLTEANKSNIMPLYDYLKGKKSQELELIDHMTRYVKQRNLSYKQLESFTSALKWYEKATVFNNYSPEKLSGLMLSIN